VPLGDREPAEDGDDERRQEDGGKEKGHGLAAGADPFSRSGHEWMGIDCIRTESGIVKARSRIVTDCPGPGGRRSIGVEDFLHGRLPLTDTPPFRAGQIPLSIRAKV